MTRIVLSLVLLVGLGGTIARADIEERARTFLMMRIIEALDLSDEKALEVRSVLRRAEARRRSSVAKRDDVHRRLRAALEARAPAATIEALVAEAAADDEAVAMLPAQSFRDLQAILTPTQQAKLLLERRALQDDVRGTLRRRWGASQEP